MLWVFFYVIFFVLLVVCFLIWQIEGLSMFTVQIIKRNKAHQPLELCSNRATFSCYVVQR